MTSQPAPLWRASRPRNTDGPESGAVGLDLGALDVVGLGEISLDQLGLVDDLASLGTLDKAPLHSLERQAGGTIATAVLGCARLGLRCGLIAATGADEAGELARSSLRAGGVDLTSLREIEGAATRAAIILVDRRTGDRNVLFQRDPRLALPPGELRREEILRARALMVDTSDPDASAWAAGIARQAGIPVLLDADQAWPRPERLLAAVDFPVVSERLAEEFGGTGRARDGLLALSSHGAVMTVATRGERGAAALFGTEWIESSGFSIAPVDTTGAGDAFRAGFIWGVLEGKSAVEVLDVANAAGALNCLALGAQAGLPRRAEIEALMRGRVEKETQAMQKTQRSTKATSGNALLVVLFLLLVAGAGGYNYHRNLQAEAAEQGPRPFRGYGDSDLEELKTAYAVQVDSRKGDYEKLARRRVKARADAALLDEHVAEFERIQRASDEKRAVAGVVAENQARLREIEAELAYRQYMEGGPMLHLKRLITL